MNTATQKHLFTNINKCVRFVYVSYTSVSGEKSEVKLHLQYMEIGIYYRNIFMSSSDSFQNNKKKTTKFFIIKKNDKQMKLKQIQLICD